MVADSAVSLSCNKTVDQFSEAYKMEYIQSELIMAHQFNYCGLCLSQQPDTHKPTCMTQRCPAAAIASDNLEAK